MNKNKLIHQLFIGKVAEILGQEKTIKLLKEANAAFQDVECDHYFPATKNGYKNCEFCSAPFANFKEKKDDLGIVGGKYFL